MRDQSDPELNGRSMVACVGELLWDLLPSGQQLLGGAPANVAYHLSLLGMDARLISRVGADDLGAAALAELRRLGLSDAAVQVDATLPTGTAVATASGGAVHYEFATPAAWDAIELHEIGVPYAIVFGTLAQRDIRSRRTLRTLIRNASARVYDLNLRPPHTPMTTVSELLELATVVKMNEQEAASLAAHLNSPSEPRLLVDVLTSRFALQVVCITRGERGACLGTRGEWAEIVAVPVDVVDTVGAGDAFLAAIVAGQLSGRSWQETLRRANDLAARVASKAGAMPQLSIS